IESQSNASHDLFIRRQLVLDAAAEAAHDAVREFASGLLLSQGRLGVHADLLREYTALIANELLEMVASADVFRDSPLCPWQDDPITASATRACEQAILDREQVGDLWPYRRDASEDRLTWCAAVRQWEAFKFVNLIPPGTREKIPEAVYRS